MEKDWSVRLKTEEERSEEQEERNYRTPESPIRHTNAVTGYGPGDRNAVLVLTYSVREYSKGNGYAQVDYIFQQIAIGTDNVYKTAEAIKICGVEIIREPGPLPGINTKIAVFLDPDGWKTVFVDNIDFLKELE